MTTIPQVSVVMSVYNGADHLAETLDSVLSQQDCDFEFIVIDDGSTDASAQILEEYAARNPCLRVVHQENTGLTRALIRGCELARGEFIARQDVGDVSLPGRLASQLALIRSQPQAVMVCCAVQVLGPKGEVLSINSQPGLALDSSLRQMDPALVRGPPHHGATMFRHDAYLQSGGYRAPFVVAQDLDLWLRLTEFGQCIGLDHVFYHAPLTDGSISSRRRGDQVRLTRLALESKRVRLAGGDDGPLLAASRLGNRTKERIARCERARFHYFVGSCLRAQSPAIARDYFWQAVRDNPLHVKALIRWFGIG